MMLVELSNPKGLTGDLEQIFQIVDSIAISVLSDYYLGEGEKGYAMMKPILNAIKDFEKETE